MRAPFCEFTIWLLLNFVAQFISDLFTGVRGEKETYEDIGHDVIGLPANRTDTQPVSPGTIHTIHGNIIPARDSHAVILIDDRRVCDERVVARTDIEAI